MVSGTVQSDLSHGIIMPDIPCSSFKWFFVLFLFVVVVSFCLFVVFFKDTFRPKIMLQSSGRMFGQKKMIRAKRGIWK